VAASPATETTPTTRRSRGRHYRLAIEQPSDAADEGRRPVGDTHGGHARRAPAEPDGELEQRLGGGAPSAGLADHGVVAEEFGELAKLPAGDPVERLEPEHGDGRVHHREPARVSPGEVGDLVSEHGLELRVAQPEAGHQADLVPTERNRRDDGVAHRAA
jgi:hypothetical protein